MEEEVKWYKHGHCVSVLCAFGERELTWAQKVPQKYPSLHTENTWQEKIGQDLMFQTQWDSKYGETEDILNVF